MPYLPLRACEYPGCPNKFTPGVDGEGWMCSEHVTKSRREKNVADYAKRKKDPIGQLYHESDWLKTRAAYLVRNPICLALDDDGFGNQRQCTRPATDLHHLISPRKDITKMYEWSNLRGLCKSHHHKKAGEDESDPREYAQPVLFEMTYAAI